MSHPTTHNFIPKRAATHPARHVLVAFGSTIPIGLVGALSGMKDAESRLPVLVGGTGLPRRRAIPLNLVIGFLTLGMAFSVRGRVLPWEQVTRSSPCWAHRSWAV